MGLFSFLKKKKTTLTDNRKLYEVVCNITFNKVVVSKQRFTIKANSKYAAKKQVSEMVKISPKRAKKYNPSTKLQKL